MDRRRFLLATGSAFTALAASGGMVRGAAALDGPVAYGPLEKDPQGVLDLPEGFRYRVLSQLGDSMSDGGTVPDKADGMGCFDGADGEIVLVRNHELAPLDQPGGAITQGYSKRHGQFLPGGTTHLVLDAKTLERKREFRSLGGTVRNCAGGTTPWGSWLSCEEPVDRSVIPYVDQLSRDHGWVFEVPAAATGLVDAVPLKGLGRFNHEAACVDPVTGFVYLTEDQGDGVLYRFIPHEPGNLHLGGRLQAMRVADVPDSRNWTEPHMPVRKAFGVEWLDLDDVEAPEDDLRHRAVAAGATLVARGEGIHMGQHELYVCSTSGGAKKLGQIFRLTPGRDTGLDRVELFFESESKQQFDYGDNLVVAPNGHLIVCEDQYTTIVDNHLRGITPEGRPYVLGRLRMQTELAGACFSPDGQWLFVNAYSPTRTFAITGPWDRFAQS